MNNPTNPPPESLPTLTEVVSWPSGDTEVVPFDSGRVPLDEAAQAAEAAPPAPVEAAPAGALASPPAALPSEEDLIQRVLADVQRQVDLMLDYRLREVLTPILTRAADSIVREARAELASTLRDIVTRAVAQELSRHRGR